MTLDPPKTVDYVDPERYIGRWYEQSSIPAFFSKGCTDTQAFYGLIDDKTISVANTCTKDGKKTETDAKAYIQDSSNSKLKVEFFPIFGIGDYWIVKLGDTEDYGFSVVSTPDYKLLWILSREEKMDEETYDNIINWLKTQGGFQVDKLIRTPR